MNLNETWLLYSSIILMITELLINFRTAFWKKVHNTFIDLFIIFIREMSWNIKENKLLNFIAAFKFYVKWTRVILLSSLSKTLLL